MKCEKCSSKKNVRSRPIFGMYHTVLCHKCEREWELYIIKDPDVFLFKAINHIYPNVSLEEQGELYSLSTDVVENLHPVLDNWLMGKRNA